MYNYTSKRENVPVTLQIYLMNKCAAVQTSVYAEPVQSIVEPTPIHSICNYDADMFYTKTKWIYLYRIRLVLKYRKLPNYIDPKQA